MFETFFGLQQTPFGRQIATANLYASAQFQELLARLQYMVQKRLLGLVTGEIGAGKSTALRALRDHLDPAHFRWLYLSDSSFTPRRTFYRELSVQLDREPRFITAEAKRVFQTAVLDLYQNQQKTPVLVVDEAHLLSGLMLEEIRFLTNFAMDSLSPMALILVGQPELRRTLALQAFEPIQQRVNLRFHLGGFTAEETHSYVKHQLDCQAPTRRGRVPPRPLYPRSAPGHLPVHPGHCPPHQQCLHQLPAGCLYPQRERHR